MIPNVLVIGEPGSGKSVAAARDAVAFTGAVVVLDPHRESLARLVLEHATGNVLFDRVSDLDHVLGYELLKPSVHADPLKRYQQNERRARLFVEIMMRRRGGDIASSPLMEEYVMALLLGFLTQRISQPVRILPYGLRPGTDEFRAFVQGITLPELREKFLQLEGLKPRSLRSEIGSVTRLVDAVFRSPSFIARCEGTFDLGRFLQNRGKLIVERFDENEDVSRTIMCGLNMLVTDHCESREEPWPPVRIYLDECTNARTAGAFEERKAGETRKFGLSWYFLCQYPNFPAGPDGYFQNCQRKEVYRTGNYELARKMAAMILPGLPKREEETRAGRMDALTTEIMTLEVGVRYVIDQGHARKQYVPMLASPWPDWPGLRAEKYLEKLCEIYTRPEYRKAAALPSQDFCEPVTLPPSNSRDVSSPAVRLTLRRLEKRQTAGSKKNDDANECA